MVTKRRRTESPHVHSWRPMTFDIRDPADGGSSAWVWCVCLGCRKHAVIETEIADSSEVPRAGRIPRL